MAWQGKAGVCINVCGNCTMANEIETRDYLAERLAIKLQRIQTEIVSIGGAELRSLTERIVVALRTRNIERLKVLNEEFEDWISRNAGDTTNLVNVATMLRFFVYVFCEENFCDEEETESAPAIDS